MKDTLPSFILWCFRPPSPYLSEAKIGVVLPWWKLPGYQNRRDHKHKIKKSCLCTRKKNSQLWEHFSFGWLNRSLRGLLSPCTSIFQRCNREKRKLGFVSWSVKAISCILFDHFCRSSKMYYTACCDHEDQTHIQSNFQQPIFIFPL